MSPSYRGTSMRGLIALKIGTEPVGMTKLVPGSLRSMTMDWLIKKVESCANEMERAMVDAQTGRILMKDLNSSTWVMVHNLHLLLELLPLVLTTAALSKNLMKSCLWC